MCEVCGASFRHRVSLRNHRRHHEKGQFFSAEQVCAWCSGIAVHLCCAVALPFFRSLPGSCFPLSFVPSAFVLWNAVRMHHFKWHTIIALTWHHRRMYIVTPTSCKQLSLFKLCLQLNIFFTASFISQFFFSAFLSYLGWYRIWGKASMLSFV